MQQSKKVQVVEEPMKKALEFMNDVVKNVHEELVEINLNDGEEGERLVRVSNSLSKEEGSKMIALLRENKDVFS